MGSTVDTSGIARQVWQRLVKHGDSNGDSRLDKTELDALKAGSKSGADIDQMIAAFDSDGDKGLSADEMPSTAFGAMTFGALLDAQGYRAADAASRSAEDDRVVDALFARADVDGDGYLSSSEMDAEKAMRQTRWLDGQASDEDPMFLVMPGANQDRISRSDISVGRSLGRTLTALPPEQMPAEVRALLAQGPATASNPASGDKPTSAPAPTAAQQRQTVETKVPNTKLDTSYVSRLLAQLSASIGSGRVNDPAA